VNDPICSPDSNGDSKTIKRVACFGDGLTEGTMTFDWVERIEQRLVYQHYEFINCGVNGYTAFHLLEKLKREQGNFKVQHVMLQIGTNDILAAYSADFLREAKTDLPKMYQGRRFDKESFISTLAEIMQILSEKTSGAKIAFLSIPPIGEDIKSSVNEKVREYNEAAQVLVEEKYNGIYLPLGEKLTELLEKHYGVKLNPSDTPTDPKEQEAPRPRPPQFEAVFWKVALDTYPGILQRFLLRRSWNKISAGRGLYITNDHIHLNERAGIIIVNMVEQYLIKPRTDSN